MSWVKASPKAHTLSQAIKLQIPRLKTGQVIGKLFRTWLRSLFIIVFERNVEYPPHAGFSRLQDERGNHSYPLIILKDMFMTLTPSQRDWLPVIGVFQWE